MIHAAHASRYHWGEAPECKPENLARGEWQVSRVYTVVGFPEAALRHARRCLDICEEHGLGDWDLAYAYEAVARGVQDRRRRSRGARRTRSSRPRCRSRTTRTASTSTKDLATL